MCNNTSALNPSGVLVNGIEALSEVVIFKDPPHSTATHCVIRLALKFAPPLNLLALKFMPPPYLHRPPPKNNYRSQMKSVVYLQLVD